MIAPNSRSRLAGVLLLTSMLALIAGAAVVEILIRPARDEDRPAVLALAARLAEGVASWRDPEAAVDAARKWLDASLDPARARRGEIFVAVGTTSGGKSSASSRSTSGGTSRGRWKLMWVTWRWPRPPSAPVWDAA
jgi:hypothetical protein